MRRADGIHRPLRPGTRTATRAPVPAPSPMAGGSYAGTFGRLKWTPDFGPVGKVVRKARSSVRRSRFDEYTYQAFASVQGEGRARCRARRRHGPSAVQALRRARESDLHVEARVPRERRARVLERREQGVVQLGPLVAPCEAHRCRGRLRRSCDEEETTNM
jgi:hypothetical protein